MHRQSGRGRIDRRSNFLLLIVPVFLYVAFFLELNQSGPFGLWTPFFKRCPDQDSVRHGNTSERRYPFLVIVLCGLSPNYLSPILAWLHL
jgi:hypothetical protein